MNTETPAIDLIYFLADRPTAAVLRRSLFVRLWEEERGYGSSDNPVWK